MRLAVSAADAGGLRLATHRLALSMLSPVCGLDQMIGTMSRGRHDPRLIVSGAELTGVHVLLDQEKPGSYHIGGTGIRPDEALIRALGESVERYAQLTSGLDGGHRVVTASHREMLAAGRPTVDDGALRFLSEEQRAGIGERFQAFTPDAPTGWVEAASLTGGRLWVPAQLVLVGYRVRHDAGEPWLMPAVTTGTAAHTSPIHALRNALLELIQIDAAMGHWYSAAVAPRIALDDRGAAVRRIVDARFEPRGPRPRFHWLPHPDLPGVTVACVIEAPPGTVPATAVGLGADLTLGRALYKALLEAVGVYQLAKLNLAQQAVEDAGTPEPDPTRFLDLDANVAWYAEPEQRGAIDAKFDPAETVTARDLPADSERRPRQDVRALIDGFAAAGHELVCLDLTGPDIADLGFVALRAWSPRLLAMPLPSLPPLDHPRFAAYGGADHTRPHPYP